MMGTLHAKEDYSQYPISDSQNDHDQNNFGQNDHGLAGFNTQGETAIPAQLEHHTETDQVSERVRSIIGGKNMFRVHTPSDDSTWQDATQKTAHWGELSEGGGHAGTLPTPPNTHNLTTHNLTTLTSQHQPHNINLKSSMLEATINNYCIAEQLQLRSDNSQWELLPKGCTDAMINSEFCYGDSSIMGARLQGAQPHGAQPHDYDSQPHGAQPHGAESHGAESESIGKYLLDIGSPQDVAAAYSSMSSASGASSASVASSSTLYRTLSKTLSKVMTSYTESTDAHGSISNNRHALELVRDIERSFHGKTITVSA